MVLRDERGQALAEAAVILPVLIALVLSVAVFGIIINSRIVVTAAAKEGARQFALHPDTGLARSRVVQAMQGLPFEHGSVVLFNPNSDIILRTEGANVRVTVTYRQPVIVPGIGVLLGGRAFDPYIVLQAEAVHRRERD